MFISVPRADTHFQRPDSRAISQRVRAETTASSTMIGFVVNPAASFE